LAHAVEKIQAANFLDLRFLICLLDRQWQDDNETKGADKLFIDIRLIDKWNNCVSKSG
jgi:hypothetical protein